MSVTKPGLDAPASRLADQDLLEDAHSALLFSPHSMLKLAVATLQSC